MLFQRVQEVEFVGGPFDGHRQTIRLPSEDRREVIAIPVNENVFRLLEGVRQGPKSLPSSIAVYELRKRKGSCRYHFTGAKSPNEFDVKNQRI